MIRPNLNIPKKQILTILILAVIFSLLGYFTNSFVSLNKDKSHEKKIAQLNEQITLLEDTILNSDPGKSEEEIERIINQRVEKECPKCEDANYPQIAYIPSGLFDNKEKDEIKEKVLEPFFSFNEDEGITYIAILVEKLSQEDNDIFQYDIQAVSKDGVYSGFLFGEDEPLELWIPDCMDGCEFSDDFKKDFPKTVEQYNKIFND